MFVSAVIGNWRPPAALVMASVVGAMNEPSFASIVALESPLVIA